MKYELIWKMFSGKCFESSLCMVSDHKHIINYLDKRSYIYCEPVEVMVNAYRIKDDSEYIILLHYKFIH